MALIGAGSFFSPSPQYAVEQAPSSMEVVIVNEREVKEEKEQIPEEIISVKDPAVQAPQVVKEKKKELQEKKLTKPIYIPPVKGALTEAKPAYFKNPAPLYPNYAREQGWEGIVFLKVLVNSDGTVGEIGVEKSSGYKILDESALKTINTWQFLPARVGAMSFSSWIKIPVRFILTEESR
jgi:periplasmic protein TonB